jgi:enoyl-CoA hydratase/carnithine racemase
MDLKTIRFACRDRVATVTLARPHVLNAISVEMLDELERVFADAAANDSVRVVVIRGEGRAFCAGADLSAVGDAVANGGGSDPFLSRIATVLGGLRNMPKPVIAAINGIALGGGLELALCADIVVASDAAKIGDGHVRFGVIPGAGGTAILPRILGPVVAKYLLFTGEAVPAVELAHTGLLAAVYPADRFDEKLVALAERIAEKSPLGLRVIKRLVAEGLETSVTGALELELEANKRYSTSEDMKEGARAFAEKRKPLFLGR